MFRLRSPRASRPIAVPSRTSPQREQILFAGFFERDQQRRERARRRTRVIVASVAVHVLVFGGLWWLSMWKTDELFGEMVAVKMTAPDEGDEAGGEQAGEAGRVRAVKKRVSRISTERVAGLRLRLQAGQAKADVQVQAPEPDFAGGAAVRGYLETLVGVHLAERVAYPGDAAALGLRGTVTLRLAIGRDGRLVDASVKEPCPHPVLCQAALQGARRAAPFAGHDGGHGDPWLISVPLDFRP